MWIEIFFNDKYFDIKSRHPPCEDVDWNSPASRRRRVNGCHPPCEDVDWNFRYLVVIHCYFCHPPCEDVDWNVQPAGIGTVVGQVILRVRMWIEIHRGRFGYRRRAVILRVRMWIEIDNIKAMQELAERHPPCEDVDWNSLRRAATRCASGHPPCEDVDWNQFIVVRMKEDGTSSSVWGCGLKFHALAKLIIHPVSSSVWGCGLKSFPSAYSPPPFLSSSVWGCGLKYCLPRYRFLVFRVILRVRMWIEMSAAAADEGRRLVILRVRMWIEITTYRIWYAGDEGSSSVWGCGLKFAVANQLI